MIKNPAGAEEGIKIVAPDKNSKLLLMINNEYSDGRDSSWLWDVDFSILKNYSGKIYLAGKCAYDIALRLKYLGFSMDQIVIEENIEQAFNLVYEELKENQTLYALPCYSAMVELENILKKKHIL